MVTGGDENSLLNLLEPDAGLQNVSSELVDQDSLVKTIMSTLLPVIANNASNYTSTTPSPSMYPGVGADDIIIAATATPFCMKWSPTNHIFFQLANAFLFLSYLAPNGIYGILYLRSTLMIGCFFFAIWGYMIICALDTLVWNALFVVINFIHFCVLLFYLRPVKFDREIENLYRELFVPLKVTRHQFKKVLGCMKEIRTVRATESYAVEKQTRVDKLSLVISGRLVVSQSGKALHIVGAHQFLDSPEWFGVSTDEYFQVTITAVEESRILLWNRDKLKLTINGDSFLQAIFDHILGKDVVKKLMQSFNSRNAYNCQFNLTELNVLSCYGEDPERVVNESFMTNGKLPNCDYGEDKPMLTLQSNKHEDISVLANLLNKQAQGTDSNTGWRLGKIKEEEHETAV